jgi:ABC-2 type transport system ATP-binding protein
MAMVQATGSRARWWGGVASVGRVLEVEALSKRYGSLLALDDVGFVVEPGQIVGLLGPNGAGKTTTMRAIMGLVALDRGTVLWRGGAVDRRVRQRFGYMPAERGMYQRMTVRDHLVYYGRLSGFDEMAAVRSTDGWLERLGLADRAGDPVQTLSSGNQQRVQLALALLNEPELLVLDEPFSGLDPVAVEVLGAILREQVAAGAALLLSSHQLDLVADVCSTVVIIDHGQVVLRGEVADLRAAGPTRYLEVEFARSTPWDPPVEVRADEGGRRYRATLAVGSDARDLLAHAHAQGEVTGYSFAPPDLSEVFLGVVGRSTVEDIGDTSDGESASSTEPAATEGAQP